MKGRVPLASKTQIPADPALAIGETTAKHSGDPRSKKGMSQVRARKAHL
jgi:hypothetical protein